HRILSYRSPLCTLVPQGCDLRREGSPDPSLRFVQQAHLCFAGKLREDTEMDSAATVARPKGLPQPLTKFVGRDAELRSLKSLLRESRLVTIIGTGGAGKTRLATELVRTASEDRKSTRL